MTISSEVDERTLREISLVPFEAAVHEAHTWSLMAAYNRLHGTYCSEHPLLDQLVKDEWNFDGVIMSDWYGAHSTVPAANAGLDLEMPGPAQWFGANLAAAVRAGDVSEDIVDDKVRRMLLLLERTGGLDTPDFGPEQSVDDPEDRAIVRRAAAESFVLLENHDALLPIAQPGDGAAPPVLAVIGPNAAVAMIQGGESARVSQFRRSPRWPVCTSGSTLRSAWNTNAGAPASSRRRCSTRPCSTGTWRSRTTQAANAAVIPCSSSRVTAAGSPSPGHSRPKSRPSSRCASRARWWRRSRARGRSGWCRSGGPVCRSTASSWSTTGSPPAVAKRSWASRAPKPRRRSSSPPVSPTGSRSSTCSRARPRARWPSAAHPPRRPICSNAGRARGACRRGRVRGRDRR